MRELPSATIPKTLNMSNALFRTTSQLKFFGIDLPFTVTKLSRTNEPRSRTTATATSLSLGIGLSIVVFAPSNERKTRQILLVHRDMLRRVVHATNLKPWILLVWIALLVFCFG